MTAGLLPPLLPPGYHRRATAIIATRRALCCLACMMTSYMDCFMGLPHSDAADGEAPRCIKTSSQRAAEGLVDHGRVTFRGKCQIRHRTLMFCIMKTAYNGCLVC
jgi:hypothetical protein